MNIEPSENMLSDDSPVRYGQVYLIDGIPRFSELSGTVAELKRAMDADEVRQCDVFPSAFRPSNEVEKPEVRAK